jgi:hypothetical protein
MMPLPKAVTKTQQGGAAWAMISVPRQGNWRAELESQGKMDLFGTLLKARMNSTTDDDRTANMKQYIAMIQQQDDLFDVAMGAMCRAIEAQLGGGVSIVLGDYESIRANAPQIDEMRDEMLEYIKDVERLLAFGLDPMDPSNKTKLQIIYTSPTETLSSLLLFPWRITNVFILGLARLMVNLRQDDSILQEINEQASLQTLLANQWESYVMAEAYRLTAKDLRDGFYLNQGTGSFKRYVKVFWSDLVVELTAGANLLADREGCKNLIKQDGVDVPYSRIAASVYAAYKAGTLDRLLQLFSNCGTTTHADGLSDEYLPNRSEWDLSIDGVTLKQLLEQMDDTTLQFILHLAYTIQKVESEPASAAVGAPGPGPGPSSSDAEVAALRARLAQLEQDCDEFKKIAEGSPQMRANIAERNAQIATRNAQIAQLQAAVQPSAPPADENASVGTSGLLPGSVNASTNTSGLPPGSVNASVALPPGSGIATLAPGWAPPPSPPATPPPSPPLGPNGTTGSQIPGMNLSGAETAAKEKMEAAKAKLKEKFGSLTGLTHPKNVEAAAASLEDKSKLAANILRNKGEIPEGATHEEVEAAAEALKEEHINEASAAITEDRKQAIIDSGDQKLIDKYTKPKKVAGRNVEPNAPPRINSAEEKEEKAKAKAKEEEEAAEKKKAANAAAKAKEEEEAAAKAKEEEEAAAKAKEEEEAAEKKKAMNALNQARRNSVKNPRKGSSIRVSQKRGRRR